MFGQGGGSPSAATVTTAAPTPLLPPIPLGSPANVPNPNPAADSNANLDSPNHKIHWLKSPAALFGWLGHTQGVIDWRKSAGCVTKDELFAELGRTSTPYATIEHLTHFPRIKNHFYACASDTYGNGEHLAEFIKRFNPETEIDRDLILLFFATIFWGGPGGKRPFFVITSNDGRGVGKSTLTDMAARLVGGTIEISQQEDASIIRQRLLSPEGLNKRIVRLDNVKTSKFSWAELEAFITAPTISGKKLYVGEGQRPNTMTWMATLNGASLGADIAPRSILIYLKRPNYAGDWDADTNLYLTTHRTAIIADIISFLALTSNPCTHTRWGPWEQQVLTKLPAPQRVQDVIKDRQKATDVEAEEIQMVEEFIAEKLTRLEFDPVYERIHIPSPVAAQWYIDCTKERKTIIAASRTLAQACSEHRTQFLSVNSSRTYGRGFVWTGSAAIPEEYGVMPDIAYDLTDRLELKRQQKKWGTDGPEFWK